MTQERKFRYSEIFGGHGFTDSSGVFHGGSMQGEGRYTGYPTVWFRSWGCNLNCNGFGQVDPTDPGCYKLPYQDIKVEDFSNVEQLPVFSTGCDSSYSWSKKFINLANNQTASEIVGEIRKRLVDGKFTHSKTGQDCHMAFTGGEPLMAQTAIVEIMRTFADQGDVPQHVTIETNGTQPIRDIFRHTFEYNEFDDNHKLSVLLDTLGFKELFWSVSPKIFATSGEPFEKAIKPEIVASYHDISNQGQLKFVCNGTQRSWDEIDYAVGLYRAAGVTFPVWIMPVGATIEGQEMVAADVADQALLRGYLISARVHTYIWGNAVGR